MSMFDKIIGLSPAERDVMRCLFFHGPTEDGDIPSKAARGDLVKRGFAHHEFGFAWLTRDGIEFGIKILLLDQQKEKWQRDRRSAA